MLFQLFIIGAIFSLVVVAFVHSFFGEKVLLQPMFKSRGNKVLDSAYARAVLRGAWHLTSLLWLMIASILYVIPLNSSLLFISHVLLILGVGFTLIGLLDLIASRGRHIGWPLLTGIGVFCLMAYKYQAAGL